MLSLSLSLHHTSKEKKKDHSYFIKKKDDIFFPFKIRKQNTEWLNSSLFYSKSPFESFMEF
jgi:hypothetical protein